MTGRIDLIPQSYHAAIRRQRLVYRWIGLDAGYAVVLLLGVGVFLAIGPTYNNAELHQRIRQMTDQQNQFNQRIASSQQQLHLVARKLAANRAVTDQPDWGILLALLAQDSQEHVVLDTVQMAPVIPADGIAATSQPAAGNTHPRPDPASAQAYRLVLQGSARSQAEVSRFLLQLENSRLFTRVELMDSKRDRLQTIEVVRFKVDCTFASGKEAPA